MVVQKDIVAISIPFSAGVATAAFMPPGMTLSYIMAEAGCLVSLTLLAVLCAGRRSPRVLFPLLFYALGIFCCANARLNLTPGTHIWAAADKALRALDSLMDAVSFRHGETNALMKAMIAGERGALDTGIIQVFRRSGASHILALSGLHLGVIYGILSKCLAWTGNSRAGRLIRSIAIIAVSLFYTRMTGAGPSVTRAFLFITINEISGLLSGRRRRPLAVLATALMVQLVLNPLIIRSIGFQLSYLAMLGILTVYPRLEGWYPEGQKADPVRKIWKSMALTLSCQVFTAPLVWTTFGTFPKYFLLTNLLSLPLSEVFIVSSMATVGLSAAGCCPEIMKDLTDAVGQVLIKSLETIASLT